MSAGAWVNLGFALRRAALHRADDPEEMNRARVRSALQAFDRALQLDADNNGKNIRVWTGMSLAYHMLAMYEKELECCAQALESDRSDPRLWLLYGFALKSAGREEEALSSMPTMPTYEPANPRNSGKSLPMCNRQLKGPAGRGWRNEICGRNTSDPVGGVEGPSPPCEGGPAHCPKNGMAGS